jgi:hypothetical protein
VVQFSCDENWGPDILLLVCSQAKPGGQSWTPASSSARIWSALPEDKQARAIEFISINLQMLEKPSESGITAKCCEPLCLLA